MTYIKTNIHEVDYDYYYIKSQKISPLFLAHRLDTLYCYIKLKRELVKAFPNLILSKAEIVVWLLFLLKNNLLQELLLALYFQIPKGKLEFNLSSFSKIRPYK